MPRLEDAQVGLGPLGGIAAALRAMRSPRLVVLAVDLPRMSADFLRGLLAAERGVVPQTDDGFFEPLAAIYPHTALADAEEHLRGSDRSLQTFVRRLLASAQVSARPVLAAEAPLFVNWNHPEDVTTTG